MQDCPLVQTNLIRETPSPTSHDQARASCIMPVRCRLRTSNDRFHDKLVSETALVGFSKPAGGFSHHSGCLIGCGIPKRRIFPADIPRNAKIPGSSDGGLPRQGLGGLF
jgi:hypothetical protein